MIFCTKKPKSQQLFLQILLAASTIGVEVVFVLSYVQEVV